MNLAYPETTLRHANQYLGDWGAIMKLPLDIAQADKQNAYSAQLQSILKSRHLTALFQPIIDLDQARIHGHEGLIRGPVDTPLHSPLKLFEEAEHNDLVFEIEHLSRQVVLESFASSANEGKLFLNISPASLMQLNATKGATLAYIHKLGLDPHNVIIELTENTPTFDYDMLRRATEHYRNMGFEIAMDDLGEGFSSLRLWSEVQPDYVKIDKHFIRGINNDQVKFEFVRSIQHIAQSSGTKVIAEGIETQAELLVVKDLKIGYGQGYFLGYPLPSPIKALSHELSQELNRNTVRVYSGRTISLQKRGNVSTLIKYVQPLTPQTINDDVYARFKETPGLYALPVVNQGRPVGLISRYDVIDHFARPYTRELYGKRPCFTFMDNKPLVVEKTMSLQALSDLITNMEPHHLSNGFIITDAGQYLGMGSGHDLLREITQMQINAARYANPLTMLPGNVPISEHIDRLLESKVTFYACYCDLDTFKPFNDAYGFRRGDELIQFTGKLLSDEVASEFDFVGHIGGDDFILIFQSEDWTARCEKILTLLQNAMPDFYDEKDRLRGGIEAEDRQGNKVFSPFVSMSIGVVKVEGSTLTSHHEVSSAIASAKKQAKKINGNSLFIERRSLANITD
ncbi:MAG: GGDEF domain-containing protein [Methylophilaceae bacterium]